MVPKHSEECWQHHQALRSHQACHVISVGRSTLKGAAGQISRSFDQSKLKGKSVTISTSCQWENRSATVLDPPSPSRLCVAVKVSFQADPGSLQICVYISMMQPAARCQSVMGFPIQSSNTVLHPYPHKRPDISLANFAVPPSDLCRVSPLPSSNVHSLYIMHMLLRVGGRSRQPR